MAVTDDSRAFIGDVWRSSEVWGEQALVRDLPDGRVAAVIPFLFTWAVVVARSEDGFYDDRWCYTSLYAAVAAGAVWDGTGEPEGWHRHPITGRRRPNGDPAAEYVQP